MYTPGDLFMRFEGGGSELSPADRAEINRLNRLYVHQYIQQHGYDDQRMQVDEMQDIGIAAAREGSGVVVSVVWLIDDDNGHEQKHRCVQDLPSSISSNGQVVWYTHGAINREDDEPAAIFANGERRFYQQGLLHRPRQLGPAIIRSNGAVQHWEHGKRLQIEAAQGSGAATKGGGCCIM